MGSIEQRSNGRYYARWRTPDGKSRIRAFDRKREAEAHLVDVEGSKLKGSYVDPGRAKVKVGPWADQWLAGRTNLTPKTRERYESIVEKYIKPRWGATQLGQVTHAEIQAWVAGLGLAPATVKKIHRVLSMILAAAVKDGRLPRNVAEGISLPRVLVAEKRFLTHSQVEQLAKLVGDDWRLLVRFLAYTGLRWGEVAALKVSRVDLLRRRVIVAESVTPVRGVMVWGATKGHERREVPIPRFLAREIEQAIIGKGPDSLLFTGPRGAVLRAGTFRRAAMIPAAEAMGLCEPKIVGGRRATKSVRNADGVLVEIGLWTKHLHPHELRHTAASLAIASGADVKVVQQMLGHKSATMTLDLYGHLFGDRLDTVAEAMDAARESELATVRVTVVS